MATSASEYVATLHNGILDSLAACMMGPSFIRCSPALASDAFPQDMPSGHTVQYQMVGASTHQTDAADQIMSAGA